MSRKRPSGSPTAWSERRKAYRKQSGPCSNPGQPSPVNRKARRAHIRQAVVDAAYNEVVDGGPILDTGEDIPLYPEELSDESECPACDSSGNDGVGPCPRGCIHSSVRRARES